MAAQKGEEVAVTLFADVHYFFGSQTQKPRHHRFDKRSYVYLYENVSKRRARIQIANNAGTEDQDAFDGFLDATHIEYSYKQPSLVTVTVDDPREHSLPSKAGTEWRLPTYDLNNQNKYSYKLHGVDIYFWTKEDALSFLTAVRRTLPGDRVKVLDEPPVAAPTHREEINPLVQKLENVAISDASYHARDSASTVSDGASRSASTKTDEQPAYAPIAYNPAAPAAPETIRHREKTPPPDDGGVNPLTAATKDQGQPFSPGYQPQLGRVPSALSPQGSYFPGQPQGTGSPFNPLTGVPPPPPQPSPGLSQYGQQAGLPTQYAQQTTQYAIYPGSPGFQQPVQSPGFQQPLQSPGFQQPLGSPSFAPPPTQAHSVPPPPPTGGYSSYSYSHNQGVAQPNDYNIHQQVWRPTEGEHAHKHQPKKEPKGKIEESAGKLERGVTGFLKKVEKKYL